MSRSRQLDFKIVKKRARELRVNATPLETLLSRSFILLFSVMLYQVFQDGKVLEYMTILIMGTPLFTK